MENTKIQEVVSTIDAKIYALQVAVKTINPRYSITKDVAETLTDSFIEDLKEIKIALLQD